MRVRVLGAAAIMAVVGWEHAADMSNDPATAVEIDDLARRVQEGDRDAMEAHSAVSERPDPRTTSVIAGTRLDLLEAMETIERKHPQYVEALLLRDVYGMSYDEIAQQVGVPLGTVKAQVHHGRKLARPLLRGDT